jgi:hypothetical protein
VFALWGNAYYTASVKDTRQDEGDTLCRVLFDDSTWDDIPLKLLYRCELQEGDKVKVPGPRGKKLGRNGYVSAVALWKDSHRVSVRLETMLQEKVLIFEGDKVAVEADLVWREWKSRKVMTLEDIGLGKELVGEQEEKERRGQEAKAIRRTIGSPRREAGPPSQPSHSILPSRGRKRLPQAIDDAELGASHKRRRLEVPSTNNPSSSKPFTNHVFLLSLSHRDYHGNQLAIDQRDRKKLSLIRDIECLGGKVVSTFEELVQWGGRVSEWRNRWVWNAGDIKQVQEPSVPITEGNRGTGPFDCSERSKIFLVAESPHLCAKYLLALAAGIPCINQGWVHTKVSRIYITLMPLTYSSVRIASHGTRTFFPQVNLLEQATGVPSG